MKNPNFLLNTNSTHIVLKIKDIQKYLNPREQEELGCIISKVDSGRIKEGKKKATYLVVNQDEPYFVELSEEFGNLLKEYGFEPKKSEHWSFVFSPSPHTPAPQ